MVPCSSVKHMHVVVQQISGTFFKLQNWNSIHIEQFPFSSPPVPGNYHSLSWLLQILHINGIIHRFSSCYWLISLNKIFSVSIHVVAYDRISCILVLNNIPLYTFMSPSKIFASVGGHVSYFQLLVTWLMLQWT